MVTQYRNFQDLVANTGILKAVLDEAGRAAYAETKLGLFYRPNESPAEDITVYTEDAQNEAISMESGVYAEPNIQDRPDTGVFKYSVANFSDSLQQSIAEKNDVERILKANQFVINSENTADLIEVLTGRKSTAMRLATKVVKAFEFQHGSYLSDGKIRTLSPNGDVNESSQIAPDAINITGVTDKALELVKRLEVMLIKPEVCVLNSTMWRLLEDSPSFDKYRVIGVGYEREGAPQAVVALERYFMDNGLSISVIIENNVLQVGRTQVKTQLDGIVTFLRSQTIGTIEYYKNASWNTTPTGITQTVTNAGGIEMLSTIEFPRNRSTIFGIQASGVIAPYNPNTLLRFRIA